MPNVLNETTFEEHIAAHLAASPLYNQRRAKDFDIAHLVDREMLERFLKAQPMVWKMLTNYFPGKETETVVSEYNAQLNREVSILRLLKKGIRIKGKDVKFVQFKPTLGGTESAAYKLYVENRFSVVRQMKYSTSGPDKDNELDLCILINGLPLLTCELKNEGTNQTFNNGIYQYRYDRNPQNRMLRNCLVHFVMDNSLCYMTTKLNGAETRFLPFNQNSTNPPVEGDYPTCYMWRQIFQADSLLDLVEHFIKSVKDDNGKSVIIFPRFHQLRAVRMLRETAKSEGAGHNYLIEHSAGSGKTKTMAWLAHQLANTTNIDGTPVYDSIIMVTDRIVLNRNMADDVVAFETEAGTVKDIRRGSKKLADALNDNPPHRIIISTIQKFAFALKDIKRATQHRYAIIIDEAHTAIGNESAKDLVTALSTDEDLQSLPDFNPEEFEDELDALMAYQQVMRRMMGHISYYAFTATPKDKTYALYGKDGHTAHDLYSMKQAIDEGFILDVVKYVKSYNTMFELISTKPEEAEKKYPEKKALRVIYADLNTNAYIMMRKVSMVLDHFMHNTINKIGHQAKAMMVCDSRRAAADYKQLFDRLIHDEYNDSIKTLVAFSGEVEDSHGRRWTEASMNEDHVKDDDIRVKFKEDDFKILIVAEKFQTGFDQPLLHTMYVDRMLGGIQCIQTLSRLNRCCPGKEDTMVIDFRNEVDKIQKSFQQYYTETSLEGEVDTQRMYSMMNDVMDPGYFTMETVNSVVKALSNKKTAVGVPSILKSIVTNYIEPLEDKEKDQYRKLVNRYTRQYGFFAQFMDFVDPDLEKFYSFCKVFYKYLPYTKETLPTEILELIDLDKLRIQLGFEGQLVLEDEDNTLNAPRIGQLGVKKDDEELPVKEILNIANSPFEGFLDENDRILRQIWIDLLADQQINEAFSAQNSFDSLMTLVKEKFDEKVAEQIEKYYNFAEIIEREHAFSTMLMRKFVEALSARSSRIQNLPYDEAILKEKMYLALESEFQALMRYQASGVPAFEKFVDTLFFVLNTTSIPSLDGVDDLLKMSFNNIYTNEAIDVTLKRVFFTNLITKYEAFLKKVYYLIHGEEYIVPLEIAQRLGQSQQPSLANMVFAFDELRTLHSNMNPHFHKFSDYLQNLRDWRNQEDHISPSATEQEIDAGLKVVVAMYLYISGMCSTKLEENVTVVLEDNLDADYSIAAEER